MLLGQLQIRRLRTKALAWTDRQVDAFAAARVADRRGCAFTIGLESGLDAMATDAEKALLGNLDVAGNKNIVEFLVLDSAAKEWMPRATRVTTSVDGDDLKARSVTRNRRGEVVSEGSSLIDSNNVRSIHGFGDHADELITFARMGADLIVTADPELIGQRNQGKFVALNLMTPGEAAVLIGVWSRTIHQAFFPGYGVNNGHYYWVTARALTPSAWPGHCAFVHGERVLPNGPEMEDLAGSILDHLKMLIRGLDRMMATWQCPINNDTTDELLHDFAHVVEDAWTVHDNIALLAGRYLAITMDNPNGPGWDLVNKNWRKAIRDCGDARGPALLDYLRSDDPAMRSIKALRNHLGHRARDRMIQGQILGGDEEAWIKLDGDLLEGLVRDLAQTPEGTAGWGLAPVTPVQRVHASNTDGEAWEQIEPAHTSLDVMSFAARTIAHTAATADAAFRILAPQTDDRIPHRDRCQGIPQDQDWAGDHIADFALACSGIAGLVDRHGAMST